MTKADPLGEGAARARGASKSPSALKTISEAADMLEVPQHVLRFWETKFTQIKPLKRNGGRRYYRPEDMEVLQHIKNLLYKQGYTIKGARKAFEKKTVEQLKQEFSTVGLGQASAEVNDNAPAAAVAASEEASLPAKPASREQLESVKQELLTLSRMLRTRSLHI